jgi:CTD small phosphatase-like protein 2
MVLLDNSVISFGFNIDNGVPIVSFTGEAEDSELLHISDYLVNLSQVDDVRCANR